MTMLLLIALCAQADDAATPFRDFAERVERSIAHDDPTLLDDALDRRTLAARALLDVDPPPQVRDAFEKQVVAETKLGAIILGAVGGNGSFELLGVRTKDDRAKALFRLVSGETLNYHELYLNRDGDRVRIADLYVYASGETLADTLREGLKRSIKLSTQSLKAKIDGTADKDPLLAGHKLLTFARKFRGEGKTGDALKLLANLPAVTRLQKGILLERLVLAAQLEADDYYDAALAELEENHPGDASLDLLAFPMRLRGGAFGKAADELDRLLEQTGDADYLRLRQAQLAAARKEYGQAEKLLAAFLADRPDSWAGRRAEVMLTLAQDRFDAVADLLEQWRTRLGRPVGDLSRNPMFEKFLASDAGAAFVRRLDAERNSSEKADGNGKAETDGDGSR